MLAIVTSAVPKATLFAVFSGLAKGLSDATARRRSSPTCTSPCGCSPRRLLIGAGVCLLRPRHVSTEDQPQAVEPWEEALASEALAPGLDGLTAAERERASSAPISATSR